MFVTAPQPVVLPREIGLADASYKSFLGKAGLHSRKFNAPVESAAKTRLSFL
jgi:hypothetical protein